MEILRSLCIVFFVCSFIGCKNDSSPKEPIAHAESSNTNNKQSESSKTQALLMVQDFEFNESDKNRIAGPYISKNELSVPKDLVGQNKWIMFEGPVLENDRVAYRYYADGRHRFDIYGKKVPDLVMDTVSWKYHDLMDWGSDILKVGNSLGIGSPAIYYQDKVHTLSDWDSKTIEIIESGGKSSKIKTTFNGLKIDDQTINVTEIWSLEEGDLHSTIALSAEGGLPADMKFATGIVKHLQDHTVAETSGKFILSTWGVQSFHKQNLGMAILADTKYKPSVVDDELSHLVVFENGNDGTQYGFLADWSESIAGAQTVDEFQSNLKLEVK